MEKLGDLLGYSRYRDSGLRKEHRRHQREDAALALGYSTQNVAKTSLTRHRRDDQAGSASGSCSNSPWGQRSDRPDHRRAARRDPACRQRGNRPARRARRRHRWVGYQCQKDVVETRQMRVWHGLVDHAAPAAGSTAPSHRGGSSGRPCRKFQHPALTAATIGNPSDLRAHQPLVGQPVTAAYRRDQQNE